MMTDFVMVAWYAALPASLISCFFCFSKSGAIVVVVVVVGTADAVVV
jgi:predicted signal transduction protein with EAL and GGDEF domain